MKAAKILCCNWLRHAEGKAKGFLQFHRSQALQHFKNELRVDDCAHNELVAMVTILQNQLVRCDGLPERKVIEWFEPFFNVLKILKHNHFGSLIQFC